MSEIKTEYIPFGEEWKKEVSKLPKAILIERWAAACQKRQELESRLAQLPAPNTGKGGVWRDGNKMLPTETGVYFVQSESVGKGVVNLSDMKYAEHYFKKCFWYDESTSSPISVGDGLKNTAKMYSGNEVAKMMKASYQAGTKEIKCHCDNKTKTGQTSVMCCNMCGKPDESFWPNK